MSTERNRVRETLYEILAGADRTLLQMLDARLTNLRNQYPGKELLLYSTVQDVLTDLAEKDSQ